MIARPARPLRILARPAYSSFKHNPYTSLLYREVERAGLEVVEYRPYRAPLGPWDVMHVHWPESVFDHTLIEALPTTESLLMAARYARRQGTKLLWTIHNLRAHEYRHRALEERFWQRFIAELDGVIALTPAGLAAARARFDGLAKVPAWVVPHPHYRGQYQDTTDRASARAELGLPAEGKVLLAFGRMYEYKNVPALLRALRAAPSDPWTVVVAGKPRSPAVERELREAAAGDERVRFQLEYIESSKAQLYFRAADLVVEPYREILNSGTALLALSFDRPVLVPHHGAGVD
ncbi:MAG TPA: glycosyltransferase, partial [Polyangiaceae bacterium]